MGGVAVRMLMASPAGSEVGRRFAEWVGREPRKVLARRFGASERTVQSWREGVLPQSTTLTAMVEAWGIGFLEYVFAPVLEESDLSVQRRLARIESDIQILRGEFHAQDCGSADGAAVGRDRGVVHRPVVAPSPAQPRPDAARAPVRADRAAAPAAGGAVRPRNTLASGIAALLIGATLLHQVSGPTQDMARLRTSPTRVVRIGGREGEA